MWTLHATSLETNHQQTIPLAAQQQWLIGRSSSADISIPWDRFMSREHLRLTLHDHRVSVECLPDAKNRILYLSKAVRQCGLNSGEEFLVGSTLFRVTQQAKLDQNTIPSEEIHYPAEQLQSHSDSGAAKRLKILSELSSLLEKSLREEDFIETILNLLSQGVPNAQGIFLLHQNDQNYENSVVELVKHFSRHQMPAPQISLRLWNRCMFQKKGTVLHLWGLEDSCESTDSSFPPEEFTASPHYDWAFCVPVELLGGKSGGVYVYGQNNLQNSEENNQAQRKQLSADVKFAHLMMKLTSAVVRGRRLEKQQAILRQFFPKEITDALNSGSEGNILEPRDCELTVLFCDLSNFTSRAEKQADNLFGFLQQVSDELECATTAILRQGGVIGDFHGDAVMGFWGWPLECEHAEERACLAAIEIQQQFKTLLEKSPACESSIRIGISSGKGIAGKIGTKDQMKVTAFGSVVNRAERLQGIGKQLKSAITVELSTFQKLSNKKSKLCNKMASLKTTKAKGLEKPIECFTLNLEA